MPEPDAQKLPPSAEEMLRQVAGKQDRMVRARGRKTTAWSAFAILGTVGWSVALPTVIGVAAGLWIDQRYPSRFSWTLMLLIAGLLLGCLTAWQRVKGDQL